MAIDSQIGFSGVFAGLVVATNIKRKAKPEIAILRQQHARSQPFADFDLPRIWRIAGFPEKEGFR